MLNYRYIICPYIFEQSTKFCLIGEFKIILFKVSSQILIDPAVSRDLFPLQRFQWAIVHLSLLQNCLHWCKFFQSFLNFFGEMLSFIVDYITKKFDILLPFSYFTDIRSWTAKKHFQVSFARVTDSKIIKTKQRKSFLFWAI